jgi:ketol-acid reductoisomerase
MNTLSSSDVHQPTFDNLRVAVIGYGSQGRAHARNLRDSGVDVTVGVRPGGRTAAIAAADGFAATTPRAAAAAADVVAILIPDMEQAKCYHDEIAPVLRDGALLMFAHGFAIHYGTIEAPAACDVALVAPKSPGALVRRTFEEGQGVPCLIAVHRDATGTAEARALAYAHGIGGTRAGVLRTTFAEETETDLFGEQAVLCGGATELVAAGFETLVAAGYQPEVAYFECLHELKLIVDLLYEGGIARMHEFISDTAKYGDLTRGPKVVDDTTRARMREVLEQVRSGAFAREWIAEHAAGGQRYRAMLDRDRGHPIEAVGRRLRRTMSWLPRAAAGAGPERSRPQSAEAAR